MASGLIGLRKFLSLAGAALLLSACATSNPQTALSAPSLDTLETRLAQDIAEFSDDALAGRFPGTPGDVAAQDWLIDRYETMGLVPGADDGSWRQPVTIVRYSPDAVEMRLSRAGGTTNFSEGILGISQAGASVTFADVPIVGVDPEQETLAANSLTNRAVALPASEISRRFAQLQAAGPKAIILLAANDQEFGALRGALSRGSWRLEGATAGFTVLLLPPDDTKLFEEAIAPVAGRAPNGQGLIDYDAILDGSLTQASDRRETANIIGKLAGTRPDAGAVLVLAHYDHLGDECAPPSAVDRICNGANDNASGISVMLQAVELIARQGPLDRDVYVLATAAEEVGLIGVEAFVSNPPFPLPTIAAAFNIDTVAIAPRGGPIAILGEGETELDAGIAAVAAAQGRELIPATWQQAYLRRQDGWPLLREGVPTVMVNSALGDEERFNAYLNGPYHKPEDEFDAEMELGGAAQDILLHQGLLTYFGNLATYPVGER